MRTRLTKTTIALLLCALPLYAQAPATCVVSGTVYKVYQGQQVPAANAVLWVEKIVKNGSLFSTVRSSVRADANGVVTLTVPRSSVVYLSGDVLGLNRVGGMALSIPDSATVSLESLLPAVTVTISNVSTGQLTTETAARTAADTTLQTNITAEASTRAAADTALTAAVAGKAPLVHTHSEADVTNLVSDLAARATVAALTAHTSDTSNPHAVTKAQVGLSNADNTSDANKPVSTAQQTALDLKLAKASNLSDVANAATARTNLGLGTLSVVTPSGTPNGTKFLRDDYSWQATPFNVVDVSALATGGSGTIGSPWTGWGSLTPVTNTEYHFKKGYYSYSVSPNWLKSHVAVTGEAGTVLVYTGVGDAVTFATSMADAGSPTWNVDVRFENFQIQGGRNGIYIRGVINGSFRNVYITGYTNCAILVEGSLISEIKNAQLQGGRYGLVFAERDAVNISPLLLTSPAASGQYTTTFTVDALEARQTTVAGIWARAGSYGIDIHSSTAESNTGKGVVLDGPLNHLDHIDLEANTGSDLEINQANNRVTNSVSTGTILVNAGAHSEVSGGTLHNLTVANIVNFADIHNNNFGTGTFTDNNSTSVTGTIKYANQDSTVGYYPDSFLGNVLPRPVPLSLSGGLVATDARQSTFFQIAATSDFTLSNPTNPSNGSLVTWRVFGSGGARSITYGSAFQPLTGTLPSSVASGAYTYLRAIYNSATAKWEVSNPTPSQLGSGTPSSSNFLEGDGAWAVPPNFTGDAGSGGASGYVPAPAAGDAAAGKFLKADGSWSVPPGGGGGTTAGGSNTQLQYNNGGVLAGASGATSNGTNLSTAAGTFRPTDTADANGNKLFGFTATTSAVNYVNVTNAATGGAPIFTAAGTDTNVGLKFLNKGTGAFTFQWSTNANDNVSVSSLGTLSGRTTTNTRFQLVSNSGVATTYRAASDGLYCFNSTTDLGGGSIDACTGRAFAGGIKPSTGAGAGVWATGQSANHDNAGQLTLSGGTASFSFVRTYTSAPICTASDTTAANAVQVTTTTAALTLTGTGTDVVNYVCFARN